jgi:WD40 repeat protein
MITNAQISKRNHTFVATVVKEGKEIAILDIKTKKQLHKLKIAKKAAVESHFTSLSFSWKDSFLAAATSTGDVHIINIKNGDVEVRQKHHFGRIHCIVFSKVQDVLYTCAEDETVKSYDLTLQKQSRQTLLIPFRNFTEFEELQQES